MFLCVLQSGHPKPSGTQVLVLGLDGAGKTSLLRYWATGSLEQDVHPSEGFNAVSINKDDLHIEFLESEPELHGSEAGQGACSGTRCQCDSCVSQLEVKRTCGPTGRGTCPKL